jgi:hypothetical protein
MAISNEALFRRRRRTDIDWSRAELSSDGIRLAPKVAAVLADGLDDLQSRYPGCDVARATFARAAIPLLAWLGLIVLIDPRRSLPDWLDDGEREMAKSGNRRPIWMPTYDLLILENAWQGATSRVCRGEIVWQFSLMPSQRIREKSLV